MIDNFDDLPKHLAKTCSMILSAFPHGISDKDYFPLLALLYDYMCDGNLAIVVSRLTKKHSGVAYNDVIRSVTTDMPPEEDIERVKSKLIPFNFKEWEENINNPDW